MTVWVFHGQAGRSVGGVFSDLETAERWIEGHSLTGLLTEYPLNEGAFDFALRMGRIRPPFANAATAGTIGAFCSHLDHHHYEDGKRIA